MGKSISVYIVDMSADFQLLLREGLERYPDITVLGMTDNGKDALRFLSRHRPDVLVIDFLLPEMDGLSLLQRLRDMDRLPWTVVLSSLVTDWTAKAASDLGVMFYLAKPCDIGAVAGYIRESVCPEYIETQWKSTAIYNFLAEFGILHYISGHRYLLAAIQQTMENPNVLHGITKILYPDLAKEFHTTSMCVEHSIRRAIHSAWKSLSPEQRKSCCGGAFYNIQQTPSNTRFIAAAADYLKHNAQNMKQRRESQYTSPVLSIKP